MCYMLRKCSDYQGVEKVYFYFTFTNERLENALRIGLILDGCIYFYK